MRSNSCRFSANHSWFSARDKGIAMSSTINIHESPLCEGLSGIDIAGGSDIGKKRESNQDHFLRAAYASAQTSSPRSKTSQLVPFIARTKRIVRVKALAKTVPKRMIVTTLDQLRYGVCEGFVRKSTHSRQFTVTHQGIKL